MKEDDIKEIFPSIMKISSHWYGVGVALGISVSKLDEIRSNNPNESLTMLIKMIHHWISNTDSPTWRSLINALYKLGHKHAASEVIADAERVILDGECESAEMSPTHKNEDGEKMVVPINKCDPEIQIINQREKRLFKKLGSLLNVSMDTVGR